MSLSTLHVPVDQRQCRQTRSSLFVDSTSTHRQLMAQRSPVSSGASCHRGVNYLEQGVTDRSYHVFQGNSNGPNCFITEHLTDRDQMRMASWYLSAQLACTSYGGPVLPIHRDCLGIDNGDDGNNINHNYPLSKTSNNPLLSEPPSRYHSGPSVPASVRNLPISRPLLPLDLAELGTADGLLHNGAFPDEQHQHYRDTAAWALTASDLVDVKPSETAFEHEMSLSMSESSRSTAGSEGHVLSDRDSSPTRRAQHIPRDNQPRLTGNHEPILRRAIFTNRVLRSNRKDIQSPHRTLMADETPSSELTTSDERSDIHSRRGATKEPELSRPKVFQRIEPKPELNGGTVVAQDLDHCAMTEKLKQVRDSRDAFLIRLRLEGKSYKEIRKLGKFTEAESTLRGRFRTLIKPRRARVRRPEWKEEDVSIRDNAAWAMLILSSLVEASEGSCI
ncbi:hypothetical protein F5884DRAFT_200718 [Xylogone sp. PMI_703]|nr:hypothetical protein F5884DRAFT_200718 [Xylogone sp. PMI_703]